MTRLVLPLLRSAAIISRIKFEASCSALVGSDMRLTTGSEWNRRILTDRFEKLKCRIDYFVIRLAIASGADLLPIADFSFYIRLGGAGNTDFFGSQVDETDYFFISGYLQGVFHIIVVGVIAGQPDRTKTESIAGQ